MIRVVPGGDGHVRRWGVISRTMSSCTAWLRYLEARENELVDADAEGILDIDDKELR